MVTYHITLQVSPAFFTLRGCPFVEEGDDGGSCVLEKKAVLGGKTGFRIGVGVFFAHFPDKHCIVPLSLCLRMKSRDHTVHKLAIHADNSERCLPA